MSLADGPSHFFATTDLRNVWVEEAKDLEQEIDLLRQLASHGSIDRFRDRMAAINRRILAHNLKTPSTVFHMRSVDAEAEIRKLTGPA